MNDPHTIVTYMNEIGWFDRPVYVVWLHGCTDGWPQAIFLSKEPAEEWVTTIQLNPEGFDIVEVDMMTLAKLIAETK